MTNRKDVGADLKLHFTQLTARQEICKKLSLGSNGELIKDGNISLSRYLAEQQQSNNLHSFAQYLDSMAPNEIITLGSIADQYDGKYTSAKEEGKFSRSKEYFKFKEGKAGPILIDCDDSDLNPNELIELMEDIIPDLKQAGKVIRYSSGAGIFKGNEQKSSLNKYHLYLFLKDQTDIPRFGKVLFTRLWLAGYGHIMVGADGALHVRSLIDGSVFSPERVIYETPPSLSDGLERRVPDPVVVDGGLLDSLSIPDLTDEENRRYDELVAEKKREKRPESKKIGDKWADKKIKEHVAAGENEVDARKLVAGQRVGFVSRDTLVHTVEGMLSIGQLAKMGYSGYFADPNEPEAGISKAKLSYDPSGKLKGVYSFLHGGKLYRLLSKDKYNRISSITPAISERLEVEYREDEYRNVIDIDAQIEVDGVLFSVGNVLNIGVNCEFNGKKYGAKIDRLITKGEQPLFISLLDIDSGGYELLQAAKEKGKKDRYAQANLYKGLDLAKCVFHHLKYDSKFFGNLYKDPFLYLKSAYPNLDSYHLDRLSRYIRIIIDMRADLAKKRTTVDTATMQKFELKRGNDGFLDWQSLFNHDHDAEIVALALPHGSGKTEVGFNRFISQYVDGKCHLLVAPLRTLAKDVSSRLSILNYEGDADEITHYGASAVSCCTPSLAVKRILALLLRLGILCGDEIENILRSLSDKESKIFKKIKGGYQAVYMALERAVREAKTVYVADADISEQTLQWLCKVRGVDRSKVLYVTAEPVETGYKTIVTYHRSSSCVKGVIQDIAEQMEKGEKLMLPVTTAKEARAIHEALKERGFKGLMVADHKGKDDSLISEFMTDPSGASLKYDYITYTSMCGTGISIDHVNPHFTKTIAIFNNTIHSATGCVQFLRRCRYVTDFEVHIYLNTNAHTGAYIEDLKEVDSHSVNKYQKNLVEVDRYLFIDSFEAALDKYGFNPEYRAGSFSGKRVSFKREDISEIMSAPDVQMPVSLVCTADEWYTKERYAITKLFNTYEIGKGNQIDEGLIEYYLTDQHKAIPHRWKQFCNGGFAGDKENQILTQAFSSVCKTELKPKDVEALKEALTANYDVFRLAKTLPDNWGRKMRKKFTAENAKAVLEWWGFDVEVSRYNSTKRKLIVSINPYLAMIHDVERLDEGAKAQAEGDELMNRIIELHEAGLSKRAIGREIGKNDNFVRRYIKRYEEEQFKNMMPALTAVSL